MEAERDALQHELVAELLLSIGWKSSNDAQWEGLRDALPKLAALASLAPEGEPVAWYLDCEQPDSLIKYRSVTFDASSVTVLHKPLYTAAQLAALTAQCAKLSDELHAKGHHDCANMISAIAAGNGEGV